MFTAVIWGAATAGLLISLARSRAKSVAALRFAVKAFLSMAPSVAAIIWTIGFILTYLPSKVVLGAIGPEAGFFGVLMAAAFGSVVLIPAFIAFPLASSFLRQGADIMAIAAFVTTLVMVGVLTAPLEAKYFGRRFTWWRNAFSFLFALVIAGLLGAILR